MKGWGKSPPRAWQQGRHGKPHREQNRIGMARVLSSGRAQALSAPPSGLVARGVRQRASQMNGRHAGIRFISGQRTEPGLQASWKLSPLN